MIHETDVAFEDYPLISLLDQGRKTGEIKDLPMPILMGLIIGTIFNSERAQQLKVISSFVSIQEDVIKACWDGVAK